MIQTSLQMFERPPLRPERADPSWTLRRAERPDPDWFRDVLKLVGQEYLWCARLYMSDDELCSVIQDPKVEVYTLRADGKDMGLLELDFRKMPSCEISFFGVAGPLVGSGAGRWLMNRATEIAWSRPIERLWLHTCTLDHPRALAFYIRSGFVPFKREVEVIADPRLAGKRPRAAAPHVPMI